MSAALKTADLPPGAEAFIRGETSPARMEPRPVLAAATVARQSAEPPAEELQIESETTPEVPKSGKPRGPKAHEDKVLSVGNVGLSFRLPGEIHHALMRASLERKLNREKPWHQQEIAAEALSNWLKKHGYL